MKTLETSTHIIITGSSLSVAMEDTLPPWFDNARICIREAINRHIPILVVCFGHQFLARILAGPAAVQRTDNPEVGWKVTAVTKDDPILGINGQTFSAFNLHFDEVVQLPINAVTIAKTRDAPIHAFSISDQYIWGIQSHPEITIETANSLLRNMLSRVPEEKREYFKKALESTPNDSGYVDQIVQSFIKQIPRKKKIC